MNKFTSKPIPVISDPENCDNRDFIDSPLVEIKPNEKIIVDMQYPVLGYKFVIWDAWRPFALQKELFISYSAKIIKEFHLEDKTKEEQEMEIGKFIANPIPDRELPPAHTTGGAVDLTIMGPDGKELEFGTDFDAFTDKTRAAYYETVDVESDPDARIIRDNRRFLYNVMIEAGFGNLPSEWWHYEYGDKNWAYIQGKPAVYDGIFEY